jgi:ribonuclease J
MSPDPLLRFLPLGGLGEVGMNCMMVECGDDVIVIDCGVMFPEEDVGVDVVHPLFDQLLEKRDRVHALVLTHGHEDHIGAVPYLLQYMNVPIYGTDFTLRLVQERVTEFDLPWRPKFVSTSTAGHFEFGRLTMDTVGVNHSIPQATSVVLRTPAGTVVHTSDFKIGAPGDPDPFDHEEFKRLGDEGVSLLLSDSTNIEKPGRTGFEAGVTEAIRRIVRQAKLGVFLTLFPSNVRRMAVFLDVARETGRQVVLVGRSVERYARAAASMGILSLDEDLVVPAHAARRLAANDLLYIVAGTQGEPRSAMSKIARGEHHQIGVREGDTVIFSSRRIPGNEMRISTVIDDLARRGATIHHMDNTPDVHVSGHGHREDLETMIRLVRPRSFMPVHGNYHYLAQHARLARENGVEDVLVVENGNVVEFSSSGLQQAGKCASGKVHVDGSLSLSEKILGERRQLADSGIVTATLLVEEGTLKRLDRPQVLCRGVFDTARFPDLVSSAQEILARTADEFRPSAAVPPVESLRRTGRKALKKFFTQAINRHPAITVIVIELAAGATRAPGVEAEA